MIPELSTEEIKVITDHLLTKCNVDSVDIIITKGPTGQPAYKIVLRTFFGTFMNFESALNLRNAFEDVISRYDAEIKELVLNEAAKKLQQALEDHNNNSKPVCNVPKVLQDSDINGLFPYINNGKTMACQLATGHTGDHYWKNTDADQIVTEYWWEGMFGQFKKCSIKEPTKSRSIIKDE